MEHRDVRARRLLDELLQLLEAVEVAHEDERLLLLLVPLAHARGEPLAARISADVLPERGDVHRLRAPRREPAQVTAPDRAGAREHRPARADRPVESVEGREALRG